MSRKSKLILATALFGAALFAASCGGGDSGEATAGTGTGTGGGGGGGNATSNATARVEGSVLALLEVNASKQVSICQLKDNNTVECGNDISSGANATLTYIHEFSNGNVLLMDSNNKLYFFDGNQVRRLTTYRQLNLPDETSAPAGIVAPNGTNVKLYATKNFAIMHNSDSPKDLVAVSKDGKVIKDNNVDEVNTHCEAVKRGSQIYKLYVDGHSFPTNIPLYLNASAGGKYVVLDTSSNKTYLSDSRCSISGVELGTIPGAYDAKIVLDGNGNFYIAVRNSSHVRYFKVSGNTSNLITLSAEPPISSAYNKYVYALDGEGRLYVINGSTPNKVFFYLTNGTRASELTSPTYAALLAFRDRVLGINSGGSVDQIRFNGTALVNSPVSSVSSTLFDRCTSSTNTIAIDGMGTDFIRCAYNESGVGGFLYSLKHSGGSYSTTERSFSSINNAEFVAGKALVRAGSTIYLCTTTDAPSISCNDIGAPDFDRTLLRVGTTDKYYLKSDGMNKVLYRSGISVKAGDIFGPPVDVPIPGVGISGGSASFDLTKFAYIPVLGPCPTSIVYLSSPNGTPKIYNMTQPSGACVKGILKVFP